MTTTTEGVDVRQESSAEVPYTAATVVPASRLTTDEVWRALGKASFAVLGFVTPSGAPRSSGVMYRVIGHRLYVAVQPESWKARHIRADGRVAVTATVRRGGLLSLVAPIPPATISFPGTATVHPWGSPRIAAILDELGPLLPPERREDVSIIEIAPEGNFVTYGIGISLLKMRSPVAARARVPARQ